MAQMNKATKRLQAALDNLERVVESRAAGDRDGDGDADLRAAFDSARQENAVLQDAADAVAARLDKTIERLKATLEA
jgi:hypothetical protein